MPKVTNTNKENKLFMRVAEAAAILDASPRSVCRMCESGELKAVKMRSEWRINIAAFNAKFGI